MAKEKPVTPEKQLLGLIENSKTTKSPTQTAAIKRYGRSFFSFNALRARFSFFKSRFKKETGQGKFYWLLDLRLLNVLEEVLICILAVYFVTNLALSNVNSKKQLIDLEASVGKGSLSAASAISPLTKGISNYLEIVRSRDIFKMGYKKTESQKEVKEASSRVLDATNHFRLVGISWSKDPDAMIEDTKAVRTFFVKRGQMMGDVKVEAITKDKVILSFEGEEVELK